MSLRYAMRSGMNVLFAEIFSEAIVVNNERPSG